MCHMFYMRSNHNMHYQSTELIGWVSFTSDVETFFPDNHLAWYGTAEEMKLTQKNKIDIKMNDRFGHRAWCLAWQ